MPPLPDYRALAGQTATKYGIPTGIFGNLVSAESGFNPAARSPAGAIGLGQLMPATAQSLGVNPNDPAQNLDGAARYLQQQYKKFGRWDLALAAYNAGPGAVQKYGGVPPYAETKAYVSKILGSQGPQPEPQVGSGVVVPQTGGSAPAPAAQAPSLGINLRQLLDAAAPSPRAIGLLGRLGGIASDTAQGLNSQIPLPPVAKTLDVFATGSTKRNTIDLQQDFDGELHPGAAPVVAAAQKYLGTPYLWGGADPRKGFDCSGFVQYLYAQQGIKLPRTTYQQVNVGQAIKDPADLRPGDILFFSDKGDVHHEGLYIGGGQFIHAPKTGDVVKISSLSEPYYQQQFFVGRRVTSEVAGSG